MRPSNAHPSSRGPSQEAQLYFNGNSGLDMGSAYSAFLRQPSTRPLLANTSFVAPNTPSQTVSSAVSRETLPLHNTPSWDSGVGSNVPSPVQPASLVRPRHGEQQYDVAQAQPLTRSKTSRSFAAAAPARFAGQHGSPSPWPRGLLQPPASLTMRSASHNGTVPVLDSTYLAHGGPVLINGEPSQQRGAQDPLAWLRAQVPDNDEGDAAYQFSFYDDAMAVVNNAEDVPEHSHSVTTLNEPCTPQPAADGSSLRMMPSRSQISFMSPVAEDSVALFNKDEFFNDQAMLTGSSPFGNQGHMPLLEPFAHIIPFDQPMERSSSNISNLSLDQRIPNNAAYMGQGPTNAEFVAGMSHFYNSPNLVDNQGPRTFARFDLSDSTQPQIGPYSFHELQPRAMERGASSHSGRSSQAQGVRARASLSRSNQRAALRSRLAPRPKNHVVASPIARPSPKTQGQAKEPDDGDASPKPKYERPQHERMVCDFCILPDGTKKTFKAQHEVTRHNATHHAVTSIKFICRDPRLMGIPTTLEPEKSLTSCARCNRGKIYNQNYNAAEHLRRVHFPNSRGTISMDAIDPWLEKREVTSVVAAAQQAHDDVLEEAAPTRPQEQLNQQFQEQPMHDAAWHEEPFFGDLFGGSTDL